MNIKKLIQKIWKIKVKNTHFKNHKVLKNLEIDFTNNGEVLNTVVIAVLRDLIKYLCKPSS